MNHLQPKSSHWADVYAAKVVREKGEKEFYTCASGITPSGTVHIGNFREIISVELVVRALREMGKKVRFIYSWDDYDVFRKVPKNMPQQEMLQAHLRWPITLVPDPYGIEESYARHHEAAVERILPVVGITPEYLYQAKRYRSSLYAEQIKRALEKREEIRRILNAHRTEPLPPDWWPISVFCGGCNRDTTDVLSWDQGYGVEYACSSCGRHETVDLRTTGLVKLLWRVDWPMRWAYERVDFEPAGKDHHSEGGSFDTASQIVREVYDWEAPVSFQYDFISIKGRGGKISSSSGEVISLEDVLAVYTPEVTRYLFAGTRPNTEFAISFDLDVIKIYEDYDRCERIAFGVEPAEEKRREKERRIYELSQVGEVPTEMPYQVPFRHLCNLLQIAGGDIEKALDMVDNLRPEDRDRMRVRARCAWTWITTFAPEDFRFSLRRPEEAPIPLSDASRRAVQAFRALLEKRLGGRDAPVEGQTAGASKEALLHKNIPKVPTETILDEKTLAEEIYRICSETGVDPKQFFVDMYRILIGKDRGPRLAGFILTIGRERVLPLLSGY